MQRSAENYLGKANLNEPPISKKLKQYPSPKRYSTENREEPKSSLAALNYFYASTYSL